MSNQQYNTFVKYYSAVTQKLHSVCDKEVSEIWQSLKESPDFPENVKVEIQKWKLKAEQKHVTLDKFWTKIPRKEPATFEVEILPSYNHQTSPNSSEIIGADEEKECPVAERKYNCPAETKLQNQIKSLQQDVLYLLDKRNTSLASDDQMKDLKLKQRELKEREYSLKQLLGSRERQRQKRVNDRKVLLENPELASKLRRRTAIGRPSCETDQPELLKTIVDIAMYGSAADERRRSEAIRYVKTLDELTTELQNKGFQISRSAVYLRLLPRRSLSTEGKRHVSTVPVRLKRATNDFHKSHIDSKFCMATIRYLEEMSSILGPDQVLFISQDDKARVPIGITAANKQAPLLMHLDYQVKLPDHDWVVGERHKLIPSVYGVMEIKPNMMGDPKSVSYSGPTFISIRSGKHCGSTARSHARDLNVFLEDQDFFYVSRDNTGAIKPVMILIVDGGPDENPRYEKVINMATEHFRRHNLDAIFVATNAPGRSAYNRVERRMAPLSRELCGVILKHDHFGNHLNDQGRTIDEELEKKNFEHAGNVLAEIWNSVVLDNCLTKATYVSPDESELPETALPSAEWQSRHVRESHYFLQIVKCNDANCCSPMRGNYTKVFPRFIPAPVCMDQSTLSVNDNSDLSNTFSSLLIRLRAGDDLLRNSKSNEVPYDTCCPSVKELIPCRTCTNCGIYFASVKSVKSHKKFCAQNSALNDSLFGAPVLTQRRLNRPVREAARRQKERMIIWTSRLNDAHADWFDDDELQNIEVETGEVEGELQNIITLEQHMQVPWEDENI